jgi:hypothetical protein
MRSSKSPHESEKGLPEPFAPSEQFITLSDMITAGNDYKPMLQIKFETDFGHNYHYHDTQTSFFLQAGK